MTIKLYETDSHMSEFTATVLSSNENGGKYEIILDKTAFFPEGGGQRSDVGTLGGAHISDVQIFDGTIIHYGDKPLEVGSSVSGKIDFALRFRNMQHHTGEHIVSGIVHSLFGFNNVGFHLGQDVTMDFDGRLSPDDLKKVERLANEAVFKNVNVTAEYPSKDALAKINYRSKLDLKDNVRIVTVDGYDKCACCAPHIRKTGEIGIIKLLDAEAYKGGTRLFLKCGFDALSDYELRCDTEAAVGAMLSANKYSLTDSVSALLKKCEEEKHLRASAENGLVEILADTIQSTDGNLALFSNPLTPDSMRKLANAVSQKCGGVLGVFSGSGDKYNFVLSSSSGKLRVFFEGFCKKFGAKGGGSDRMMFGSLTASRENLKAYFEGDKNVG